MPSGGRQVGAEGESEEVVTKAPVRLLNVRTAAAVAIAAVLLVCGCAPTVRKAEQAPAYFTQVLEDGLLYAHNWEGRPCFSIRLDSTGWKLEEATADRVVWSSDKRHLAIYLADNRDGRFAVAGMDPQQVLRAFMGYELDFVKPRFEFHVTHPPRMAQDQNGVWMLWGWEGHGGKRLNSSVDKPADQRHTIASLWVDPWVLSFDWATIDMSIPPGATAAMIDVIESLRFYPECFDPMRPGETWKTKGAPLPPVRAGAPGS